MYCFLVKKHEKQIYKLNEQKTMFAKIEDLLAIVLLIYFGMMLIELIIITIKDRRNK